MNTVYKAACPTCGNNTGDYLVYSTSPEVVEKLGKDGGYVCPACAGIAYKRCYTCHRALPHAVARVLAQLVIEAISVLEGTSQRRFANMYAGVGGSNDSFDDDGRVILCGACLERDLTTQTSPHAGRR